MRYDTQQSIHDTQKSIRELIDNETMPTRAAIAKYSGKSTSYITKLVKAYSEYIADDGSGNILIVQDIKPPVLPAKPIKDETVTARAVDNNLILTRITEVLETLTGMLTTGIVSNAGGSANGREITKNAAPVGLIPKELRTKLVKDWKTEQWKPYANIWQDYLKSRGMASLYLLHQTIEYYLSNHKDELVQAIQDKLDGKEKPVETKPAYSGPPRLPTYEELGISTEKHSWDIGTLFLNKTINRTGYQLRTVVDRGYDSFHRRQDITVQDAKDGKLIDEWNARPENENLQVDSKGLLILPIVTQSGESSGSPASN